MSAPGHCVVHEFLAASTLANTRRASRATARPYTSAGGDVLLPTVRRKVAGGLALGFFLFLHREPRQLEGGELHLRDVTDECVFEPSQNSTIFFHASIAALIGSVQPASGALIDSLLTLEGWTRD
jgi:hypothetical protein